MKKYILSTLIMTLWGCLTFAQVGVNTINPQGIFHVDGGKDNPATGVPNAIQEANDFIVTASGKTGIGTVSPTETVDINGTLRARSLSVTTDESEMLTLISPSGVIKKGLIAEVEIPGVQVLSTGNLTAGASFTINLSAFDSSHSLVTIDTGNACGRTMLTSFMKIGDAVNFLGAQARQVVGIWTITGENSGQMRFPNVIGCADGGDNTQFDFDIVFNSTSIVITNKGNIAKNFEVRVLTKL